MATTAPRWRFYGIVYTPDVPDGRLRFDYKVTAREIPSLLERCDKHADRNGFHRCTARGNAEHAYYIRTYTAPNGHSASIGAYKIEES